MTMDRGMVIVGAGEAGARAAMTLREEGWTGPITLIGEEPHVPYERPPLSKAAMLAANEPPLPFIGDMHLLKERGIAHLPGLRVEAIGREGHHVHLSDGRILAYDRLLLATGARPRRLSLPGGEAALTLRTHADALALRAVLQPGRRIVIIGGGFIGLEIAASAVERGASVTVLEAQPRILMRGVPEDIAAVIAARHAAAGVQIKTGTAIDRIAAEGDAKVVVLADGTRIEADAIVAGIGAAPDTALAEAAGLAIDNGIAVDGCLMTSDPAIFAAGDCCSAPHALYDGRRVRLEAWRNARDQGALAARNMLGAATAYDAVPWFWSDQYDLHLQIAGLADGAARIVSRDLGEGARVLFHLAADGRLLAASGVGALGRVAKEVRLAEMLIARRAICDAAALASPDVRLKTLLAA